jgi:hypothetical protein
MPLGADRRALALALERRAAVGSSWDYLSYAPTVTNFSGLLQHLRDGDEVLVDAYRGEIVIAPNADTRAEFALIVNIHSGQADQRRVIEFYGGEVLPRLAKASSSA